MAAGGASSAPHAPSIDTRTMFLLLQSVTEDNAHYFGQQRSEASRRFVAAFGRLQEDGRGLQPLLAALAAHSAAHDLDPATPANGYRSLSKVVRRCVMHAVHKSRYVAASRRSVFFRAGHNLMEVEAYSSALRQLRALLYFATSLLAANRHGDLFFSDHERGLSDEFLRESNTMHKGCFYGRCLGFQFSPSIRPFLQTISIGLVSFGENYRKHESKLGTAATSIFTSGKYAIDPELRGAEFERLTQNLDIHFWKAFWNITETEILASLVTLTSTTVRVNRVLSVPPHIIAMPLAIDPTLTVAITPPVAHSGPGPVQMRLISYELREGQDSDELSGLCGVEPALGADGRPRGKRAPPSPSLIVHFHGGGFVAQTSKSHEPYLRSWAQELDSPILSVDYSLAPEAPFPRALEECFFAYCWALKNCHLLGSTCERVCVAGDSAGGNLCLAVCMQASAYGVRMPDGVMAAYPATLLQATASPSRLLTFIDPLLPISVLSKCLSAYAGLEPAASAVEKVDPLSVVRNDTAVLLRGFRMGASAWLSSLLDSGRNSTSHDMMRKSCSETALSTAHSSSSSLDSDADFVLCPTCPLPAGPPAGAGAEEREREGQPPPSSRFPRGFQPLRSGAGNIRLQSSDTVRNPLMSPLLAPEHTLRKMPPVHLVACALDPMLDDSVMYARRLRSVSRPVTLSVVDDLPHGFLSLSPLSRETRRASALCASKIREVLAGRVPPILPPYTPPPPGPEMPTADMAPTSSSSPPPRSPTTPTSPPSPPSSSSSSTTTPPKGSPPRSYSSRLSPQTARRPSPVHSRSPSPKQAAAPLGPTDASPAPPLPPTTTAPPPNTATTASAPTMTVPPPNTATPASAPTMTATNMATTASAPNTATIASTPTMTAPPTNTATTASAPTMTATSTATPASAPTMTASTSPPAPDPPPAPRGHRKLERLVPKNPASPPPPPPPPPH